MRGGANLAPPTESKDATKAKDTSHAKFVDEDGISGPRRQNYDATDWSSSDSPFSYGYEYEKKISGASTLSPDPLSICNPPSHGLLYADDSPTFDIFGNLDSISLPLSPRTAADESQWHMFFSGSLSNPLDSLGLPVFDDPTRDLLFGSDAHNDSENVSDSTDNLALGGLRAFRNTAGPLSDTMDPQSFSPSLSQSTNTTSLSLSLPTTSLYGSDVGVDSFLLQGANESVVERIMSSSEKYASLLGITPSQSFGMKQSSFPSLSISASAFHSSVKLPTVVSSSAPKTGRGLTGWSGDSSTASPLAMPPTNIATKQLQKPRVTNTSHFPSPQVDYSVSTPPASDGAAFDADEERKSSRRRNSSLGRSLAYDLGSDDEGAGDGNDSDDYCPSRSPSVEPSLPSLPSEFMNDSRPPSSQAKKSRRGKGKARGSAALALAVVTQLGARARESSEAFEELDLLLTSRDGKPGIRKRKNHPIPLPVPVPNLNKKSRGRKVPYVDCSVSSHSLSGSQSSLDSGNGGSASPKGDSQVSGGRPKRKTSRMPTPASEEVAGARTYVCVVAGCGKCFVRGEHLKRHVRSIHTYDKPHPCPYEGCDKSFSRRDNLGQHVRIHLQP